MFGERRLKESLYLEMEEGLEDLEKVLFRV